MFKAAAVWNEKVFSWLDSKPSTRQHTTVHTQVRFLHETACSVSEKQTFCRDGLRHSECTSSWKTHHTQRIQQRGKQGQLALKRCWRARDLLNGELLTKEGKREWLLKECLAFCASSPPSVNIKSPHGSFLISFHIPQKPREPRPLSAPIFHSMWLMDLKTVISILTGCFVCFFFLLFLGCVISNQCLGGADLCPKVASAVNMRDWHISKCI